MRSTPIALLILLTVLPAVAFGQQETRTTAAVATPAPAPDPCAAMLSSEKIRTALAALDGMLSDPPPHGITAADAQEYQLHSVWLVSVRDRLGAHLAGRDTAMEARRLSLSEDPRRMATIDMEFLALQNAVQNESPEVPDPFQRLEGSSRHRDELDPEPQGLIYSAASVLSWPASTRPRRKSSM